MATSTNPIDQALSDGANPIDSSLGSVPAALPSSAPTNSSNPIDSALSGGGEPRPNNGQPSAPTQHLYQDSSQPWYKRAWDYANTPLTESLFGLPEDRQGAGGFERGVEHIVSGLTSPLSVALTAATFGTGGFIESAGMSALRESGEFTAEELPQIVKAAQTAQQAFKDSKDIEPVIADALKAGGHDMGLLQRARDLVAPLNRDADLATPEVQSSLSKIGLNEAQRTALTEGEMTSAEREAIATKNGGFSNNELKDLADTGKTVAAAKVGFKPIEDAVREAGVDPALWKKAQGILYDNGLSENDLLGGNMVERGAYQILRHTIPDLPIAVAARSAKTANTLLNAGFTLQQFESAAAMSPRFLDALKEGDTDKAWEYGTEAFAGGALGVLGTSHALHSAGELFKPLIENDKFRPNDEWLSIDRANKEKEALYSTAEQMSINLADKARYEYLGHQKPGILGLPKDVKARQDLELASVLNHMISGGDTDRAATEHDVLAQAIGRTDEPGLSPLFGQTRAGTPMFPSEIPSKTNTRVLHSNDVGEVRVGSDGRPVVWLGPEAWSTLNSKVAPGKTFAGFSFSPTDSSLAENILPKNSPIRELIAKARDASQQNMLTTAQTGHPQMVRVVAEELHHTAQRELAGEGEIRNLLDAPQVSRLSGIIPAGWAQHMNSLDYSDDPAVRVAETGAQFMAKRHLDLPGIVSGPEADDFVKEYLKEITAKYGAKAPKVFDNINEIARQHVEDINAKRNQTRTSQSGNAENIPPVLRSLPEGPGERGGQSERGNAKGVGGPEGLGSRERDNLAPVWYLKSNQLIDSRMSGPMPADTVLKMLENNGVKPDEMKYTGLQDFLREKGKEPVRPEELRSYLAANNLQIQEVTKGPRVDNRAAIESLDQRIEEINHKFSVSNKSERDALFSERETLSEQRRSLVAGDYKNTGSDTKFGSYTLPGGENYREMLLQLPSKPGLPDGWRVEPNNGRVSSRFSHVVIDPKYNEIHGFGNSPQEAEQYFLDNNPTLAGRAKGVFTASHWDEPNVVGHVRFNDRVGPNGEKLLHLEELQSDWHQKGRTQGYLSDKPRYTDLPEGYSIKQEGERFFVTAPTGEQFTSKAYNETGARNEAINRLNDEARGTTASPVPDAPFKKTWPELLMKRMVRYAAEHGYDGVSWTPGEEQAARYDLSKQISEVHYSGTNLKAYDHSGNTVINRTGITAQELPDMIGKEAAQKLMAQEPKGTLRSLVGQDLKVGGEGMKGFYDKIVPEAANKLGKQFGAKVGETKIPVSGEAFYRVRSMTDESGRQRWALFDSSGKEYPAHRWTISNQKGAEDFAETLNNTTRPKTVPYFPITDSMRESVLKQGQPLFSRENPNNGLPPDLDEQIRSNVFKNQPKEYQDLVLNSLRRVAEGSLSEKELAASKFLRDEQDNNFQIGSSNDLLHHYLEDYMTRVYKDANPLGKVILSDAKGGKFATNVTMAKQRVYDSNLTALLKSPKQMLLDPVDITARGRAMLIKAAANRQLIDTLRDKFTRASDGRPAVVLSGQGQVVAGQNGEDPKTFIDPNRVRKINVTAPVVEQLTKSGDLQRFLADGTVKDITPYVRPNNIGAAIDKLEEQSQRREAQYDSVGNNKLRTDLMFLKSMQANNDFSGLKAFNDAQEKQYAWDPQDYVSLANGAMKGWNFITNSPDGTPIYIRSDIRVHPEFAEYLQNRLGLAPSEISKHPIGKALLGAGTRLKQTLLSLSPFHMVQEALRAVMVGVNPFHITGPDILTGEKVDPSDPNSPTIIRKAVENGFTSGTDYQAMQAHSEGLAAGGGGLISKIPGVGKVLSNSLDWYQNFLFKRYIPALKARSVELMFHEYQRLHPEWSVDRVAKAAALHTNDTFGGINWQAMGRSATTQDWGRLMLLAPDWLEAEMRSGVRLFNRDDGGLGRAQVAKMALGLWGTARVLNLVTTGNAHYEAPFGLAVKNKEGRETVFGIRTLPTDLLSAASDPVRFLTGRLSPTFRAGTELASGRDQFGRKLQPTDLYVDIFRNMAPIPLQSIGQAVSDTGPQIGNIGQGWKAGGGTAQTYQTPAQKFAADAASTHSEDGPLDPSQMARHRRVLQLEDRARAGEVSWPDLYKLTYETDQLSEQELKKIQDNLKVTHGMDAGMASLYSRASRLPANEYLQLLDTTNPSERAALVPLTIKVQKRYLTKAKKEETPEERQRDPVFQRLLTMIPAQPPAQQ